MPKKGKAVKAAPPPPPTKKGFELVLRLIYNELGAERSKMIKAERINDQLRDTLLINEKDRNDITLYLSRNLEDKTNTLGDVQEQIKEVAKLRENDKKVLTNYIKDLELKFKHTRTTLIGEINILRSKLDSLEEFRAQRDTFMFKLASQETEFKERNTRSTDELFNIQRQNMVERDNLRKIIQGKIDQLCDDFEKTNEIRVAGYSRKLIRSNIALTRSLDKMMLKQSIMEVKHKAILKKYKDLVDNFKVKESKEHRLERTCKSQVVITDKLSANIFKLKQAHFELLTFKDLYEKSFDENLNYKNTETRLTEKVKNLTDSLNLVKMEKDKVAAQIKWDENLILQLGEKILTLGKIVNAKIIKERANANKFITLREVDNQRRIFLKHVDKVYESEEIFEPPTAGISKVVLEPLETTRRSREEIIERVKPVKLEVKVKVVKELGNIIPEEKDIGPDGVLDALSGTPLILSASEESFVPEEDEGGMGEAEDFGASSSESAAGMPSEEEKVPVAEVISEKSVSSISSIEYAEEEEYPYEDFEENEDD